MENNNTEEIREVAIKFAEWIRIEDFKRNGVVKEGQLWYDEKTGTYLTTAELFNNFNQNGK